MPELEVQQEQQVSEYSIIDDQNESIPLLNLNQLFDRTRSSKENTHSLARHEYIYNEDGIVVDVKFTQNGKSKTLKEVLPGDYKLRITHYSYAECEVDPELLGGYNAYENILRSNEFTDPTYQGESNLTLLHEAGHARDEYVTHAADSEHSIKSVDHYITSIFIATKREFIEQSMEDMLTPDILSAYPRAYFKKFDKIPPHEVARLQTQFDELMKTLARPMSLDEVALLEKVQHSRLEENTLKLDRKHEHTAWVYALSALLRLREEGINLYDGTNDELLNRINNSLSTRHGEYDVDDAIDSKFTIEQ